MPNKEIRLVDLVREWFKEDPILRDHIAVGSAFRDGFFFIETKCQYTHTKAYYHQDYVNAVCCNNNKNDDPKRFWKDPPSMALRAGDPDFLPKLSKLLRKWHNGCEECQQGCGVEL